MTDDDRAEDDADGFAAWGFSLILAVGMVAAMWALWLAARMNRPGG
jgi:hypothetical protein